MKRGNHTPHTHDERGHTFVQSRGSTWFQSDLGDELDVEQLSLLSDLDPTGSKGVVNDVLVMLLDSLDPTLIRVDRHRQAGQVAGIRFEAHKLQSASAQLGAMRLSAACKAVSDYVGSPSANSARPAGARMDDDVLDDLVSKMSFETVRLERRLRRLLGA